MSVHPPDTPHSKKQTEQHPKKKIETTIAAAAPMAPEEAEPTMMAETTTTTMDAAMDTEAEAGSEETAEGPALRHAQPRFDYSIGA